ncbi:MAG: hydroxymethylbilane synthase [Vicinamibacterales bacterium]
MEILRLGTRGSQLALYQANAAKALLEVDPGVRCEIVVIRTSGDRLAEAALSAVGGKRLFVKEIEEALLARSIDLAVHSSKDMPVVLPDGLVIAAALERESPYDAVVLPGQPAPSFGSIEDLVAHLGRSPRIGTSSVRRTAQLGRLIPGARFLPIRGNLDTRLRKLDAGDVDAIVLAAAGLHRLQRATRISATLPVAACVPAPGQGIIAVEVREHDGGVHELARRINDWRSAAALTAERAVVRRLGGGCQMPIGAYAALTTDARTGPNLDLTAVVISLDGARAVRANAAGAPADAEALGVRVAERLLEEGASDILADAERAHASVEGLQP